MVIQAKARKAAAKPEPPRPSPVSRIAKIASLKRYSDKDYALDLLHQMARAVAPIIHEYNFKVGTLCEMFPKSGNLLGLNVNRGQKILIRLRQHHNDRSFLPMGDLIGTFLHELTHNVHGPHDAKFYALLDELRQKYENGAFFTKDYVCEENKLGAGFQAPWATPQSVRQKRLEALSKGKFKAEVRRVGGKAPTDLRKAMLEAAERRLRDSKWCAQGQDENFDSDDLEVQELPGFESSPARSDSAASRDQPYSDIVDLTREEVGDDDDIEIVAVDACEHDNLRPSILEESTYSTSSASLGTFEMRSTVRYYVSSSPGRTFIGDESSARRKVVAELNFDHIIESAFVAEAGKAGEVEPAVVSRDPADPAASPTEALASSGDRDRGTGVTKGKGKKRAKKEEMKSEIKATSKSPSAAPAAGEAHASETSGPKQPKRRSKKANREKKGHRSPGKKKRARKEVRCVSFSELFLS